MAFFKFRKAEESKTGKRGGSARRAAGKAEDAAVHDLRMRARYRLVGAVVLVLVAVIVFPLLFDTEQRPIVVDAPVVIADGGANPADIQQGSGQDTSVAPTPSGADSTPADEPMLADSAPLPVPEPESGVEPVPELLVEAIGDADAVSEPSAERAKIRATPPAGAAREVGDAVASASRGPATDDKNRARTQDSEAQRALAALQGRSSQPSSTAASDSPGRFVVQVGAFSQEQQVRSVRQKIAGVGLKSYTQVVETDAGLRTRVRVGPYANRGAAEQARAVLEKAGLPGQVLGL